MSKNTYKEQLKMWILRAIKAELAQKAAEEHCQLMLEVMRKELEEIKRVQSTKQ